MTGVLDTDAIAQVISDGRARRLSSSEIAQQIVAMVDDPTWAKAMSHPLRGAILQLLRRDGPPSPSRAAERLDDDTTLGVVAYHFRHLEQLQLIEISDRIPRRGAIEHVYRPRADRARYQ